MSQPGSEAVETPTAAAPVTTQTGAFVDSAAEAGQPAESPGIGHRVRRGVLWTALSRASIQIVQFGTTVALARMLAPDDFGVVSLVSAVSGFTMLFVDLGVGAAIVQKRDPSESFLATAFWLNAIVGIVAAGLVWAVSPLVADFFGAPGVAHLLPIAGLSFALSLSVVPNAVLRKRLDFRRLGSMAMFSTLVTTAVSIGGATLGWGPLALVLAGVAATVANTVQAWVYAPWRPRARPSRDDARELWRYSRGLLGFNSVNYWARTADNVLIGKFLGVTSLGYYGRAYNLMMLPLNQLNAVLGTVLFPALSDLQQDGRRFGRAWLLSTKASWLVGAPLGVGMTVTAPALVETLYGERWLPMASALALLAASIPVQLVGQNTGPVFQARGETGAQFRRGIVTSALTLVAIVIALPHGFTAVATALLVKSWIAVWIPLLPALRLSGVRVVDLGRALAFSSLATLVMAAVALVPRFFLVDLPPPLILLLQVALGGVAYLSLIAWGERDYLRTMRGRRGSNDQL